MSPCYSVSAWVYAGLLALVRWPRAEVEGWMSCVELTGAVSFQPWRALQCREDQYLSSQHHVVVWRVGKGMRPRSFPTLVLG